MNQLETASSCSVSCSLVEETNPQLTASIFQGIVESDKVTSESPFLQAKQPQLPQSFLTGFVFQAPHQPCCPPLDALKHLNILPKLRGPEMDTALKVWPDQCRVQGKYDLPAPAGHAIPDPGQDAIGPLGHLGTLLAHVQPAADQYPQVPFLLGTVQPHHTQPATLQGFLWPEFRTWNLDLLNITLVDSAHPSNGSRSLCRAILLSNSLTHSPIIVLYANLLMKDSMHSSMSSIKILNRTGSVAGFLETDTERIDSDGKVLVFSTVKDIEPENQDTEPENQLFPSTKLKNK
ncbi:hypothetical protein DUI87_05097 [Hirundo rustica rustica]|uniref:Uncharacterized protein n=1 Tax=Hirundo rustica rustica TaxID=333673 RepID=A0A3M0KZL1_HIRRU|nr:hypothetical protein DUI87_05097 [Hirundo rustica rustica]